MKNPFKKTAFTRTLFFVIADIALLAFSIWMAFFIRFDGIVPMQYSQAILKVCILAFLIIIPVFYFSKLYSFSWAYVSASDAIALFEATSGSFLLLGLLVYAFKIFPDFNNFPRSVIFISFFIFFIGTGSIRFAKRVYVRGILKRNKGSKTRTLIVGAGDAGEQILRNILPSKSSPFFPIGFADDSPMKQGIMIHGFKVLGKISEIPAIVKKHRVEELIIALPTAGSRTIKNAVDFGRKAGIKKIKIVPHINEIISGKISLKTLKDVEADDLLGRDPVSIDSKEIENFIKGKTILVTGGAGSVGSELCRQIMKFAPKNLLVLDQDETGIFNIMKELEAKFNGDITSFVSDIRDKKKTKEIFQKYRPNIIFHAAAYKHVPLMEADPEEAVKNNIFGTEILAEAAVEFGAEKFIFISTDKAVNPTSVMGATKRICEMVCQRFNRDETKFISVRFGNVLDSRGSVIPIFREQIRKGGPVTVTDSRMKRYFMLISEACLLVMQAGAMGKGGEVFILDMGKPAHILELAKKMISLSGLEPDKDIAIVFSGLRPGEKLFEEILTAEEGTVATKNQKIFSAKLSDSSSESHSQKMENLRTAVSNGGKEKIISALRDLVPWYSPAKD